MNVFTAKPGALSLLWLLLLLTHLALPRPASAQEAAQATAQEHTACTIEGTAIVDKKPVQSKDCFENINAPHDDFMRVCHAMEQTAIAVTQANGSPPPAVTYGKSCPAGAVATCKGFLFMPIMHHIFKRSAHEMEVVKESCLTQNGVWK